MTSDLITACATALLAILGWLQAKVLFAQRRQSQLDLLWLYRDQWFKSKDDWGKLIFIARDLGEYYQVIDKSQLDFLERVEREACWGAPTVWALNAVSTVSVFLSDVCVRILQNQLKICDVYPILGADLLRHSRPLRVVLDVYYRTPYQGERFQSCDELNCKSHAQIRRELQDWLIYHDGIRRRCLILIDLLWAEAARLEDLPPEDLTNAADAKRISGRMNKKRIYSETLRLNGCLNLLYAVKLSGFLSNSEYKRWFSRKGLRKRRLDELNQEWVDRLSHER